MSYDICGDDFSGICQNPASPYWGSYCPRHFGLGECRIAKRHDERKAGAFCQAETQTENVQAAEAGRDVDREWEALCKTVGVALTPPSRASATVQLTLYAPISKQMLASLGTKKTMAMLKQNLTASLRNALKAMDEGGADDEL